MKNTAKNYLILTVSAEGDIVTIHVEVDKTKFKSMVEPFMGFMRMAANSTNATAQDIKEQMKKENEDTKPPT